MQSYIETLGRLIASQVAPHPRRARRMLTVCGILECPVEEYTKEALPFFLAVMLEMIVLVFFPNVVLFLPNLIYG